MKCIVTIVIKTIPPRLPKEEGKDIFGRFSTDKNSRHKCFLLSDVKCISEAREKINSYLTNLGVEYWISRIEVIKDGL